MPEKPQPHWHRRRKRLDTDKTYANIKLWDRVKARDAAKRGDMVQNVSWVAFKARYLDYSGTKDVVTQGQDIRAIKALESAIPFVRLDQITVEKLEKFKQVLSTSGRKVTTVNRYLSAIKAMLNKAIEWRLMLDPGFEYVKYFKEPKGRLKFYSIPELKKMRDTFTGFWQMMVMLGFYAGLRREEMRSLLREFIDFERDRIHIEPTEEFTPKDYERRFVPLHPALRKYLHKNMNGSRYVMGDQRPTLDGMTHGFMKRMRRLGLTGSPHILRHSFGAHNAMSGVSLRKLQTWMGHASIRTTEIYSHLSPEHLDQDIQRMPEL